MNKILFIAILVLVVCSTVDAKKKKKAKTQTTTAPESITILEWAITDVYTTSGSGTAPPGGNVGDMDIFANPLYDSTNTTQIGTDSGFCIKTSITYASWQCSITYFFPDGSVMVEGPYFESGDSVLTITGGTGVYVGAEGQVVLQLIPGTSDYETIFYPYTPMKFF